MRAAIPFALVATLLVALSVGAQAADPPLTESTFATGAEGWLSVTLPYPSAVPATVLATYTPNWVASLGGYIRLDDPDGSLPSGNAQYWVAPPAFLGAKSAAYGGSLECDLANVGTFGPFAQEDVLLIGGGLTLVHALGGLPVPAFSHFSIPMSESGWTVGAINGPPASAAQMQCALADIEHLYLRAEYLLGPDTQYLDNVVLLPGPPSGTPWTTLGFGLAGTSGIPLLVGNGTLLAGSPGSLELTNARPSSPAILFLSFASTPVVFKGGTLATVPVALSITLATSGAGSITLPWTWPSGIPAGVTLYFQYAIQDPAGPKGAALSHAVRALTP